MSLDCNNKGSVIIADKMRGVQLFSEVHKKIVVAAKSPFPMFASNAKFLGDYHIICSDINGNILILKQNEYPENDLERIRLQVS